MYKISLVSQDVVLFDDSVENNIKYAKLNATETELKNECKLSDADDFIQEMVDTAGSIAKVLGKLKSLSLEEENVLLAKTYLVSN